MIGTPNPGDRPTSQTAIDSLTDPRSLRDDADVPVDEETVDHDGDPAPSGGGDAVVGAIDDAGATLLLVNDELGVAVLPHGSVEAGGDWAATARSATEGTTGVDVALVGVEAVREVHHVRESDEEDAAEGGVATTHRVVFRGSPTGGEIQDCKRSAAAGSDDWRAGWFDELPDGVDVPGGGPGDDLELFL